MNTMITEAALPPLPEMGYFILQRGMGDVYEVPCAYTAQQMKDYARAALEAALPHLMTTAGREGDALRAIAERLRGAGASLPAPPITGTIEGSMVTGLSIALALVEEALAARQPVAQEPVRLSNGTVDGELSVASAIDQVLELFPSSGRAALQTLAGLFTHPTVYRYASPPQQPERVDLEQFRKLASDWFRLSNDRYMARKDRKLLAMYDKGLKKCSRELLALINQQEEYK